MAGLGHIAVGLAAGRAYPTRGESARKAMLAFSVIAMWPDADVIAFALGIPYGAPFGHRGATHSLTAALLVGLASGLVARWRALPIGRTMAFVTAVAVSHPLLDTLTFGGGYGCELLWPFSTERFWAPLRFIPIAPIGLGMLSPRGLVVSAAEMLLFAPFWLYATWPRRPAPST
jgi:inner membrane protein